MPPYLIIALYKFKKLASLSDLQETLQQLCYEQNILGTLILAPEGINGTIAGKSENIQIILDFLKTKLSLAKQHCQYAYATTLPFKKTKILIKNEIVALKKPGIDPSKQCGIHVAPEDWNTLISNPDVLVIDTRNTYEIKLGTFKDAINPQTETFGEFPNFVQEHLNPNQHKKIAMYCTGGIRCEKASAYLLNQGFDTVYQLKGGILNYLEKIPKAQRLWEGKCFVFDNRIVSE